VVVGLHVRQSVFRHVLVLDLIEEAKETSLFRA